MDFSRFTHLPVVDGHIHFPHATQLDDFRGVMDQTGSAQANLVAVPDLQHINGNPALIYFKALQPDRVYISGALDYSLVLADPAHAAQLLAAQPKVLKRIGFDGLKLIEGKPMVRKLLPMPLDSPPYAGFWATAEALAMPVVLHVADPEEFWDAAECPDWARANGWFYGDGTYPLKEELHAEVDHVLARHPGLKVILAHFYFLSADLPRAGRFLDAHPHVCFDLTPGVEMYYNLSRRPDASRDFFLRHQDQLVYGTDIGASAIERDPSEALNVAESLGRSWVVRQFLETDAVFGPPPAVGHWTKLDGSQFRGIALPGDVLAKIYGGNFRRFFGPVPAALHLKSALSELERLAGVMDAQAGAPVESRARLVARALRG